RSCPACSLAGRAPATSRPRAAPAPSRIPSVVAFTSSLEWIGSVSQDLGQEVLCPVRLGGGEEGFRLLPLHDSAVVHEHHAARHAAGETHLVGDHHHGQAPAGQGGHDLHPPVDYPGIERRGGPRGIFSAAAASRPFTFRGASMMFCSTVMWGKRLKDWNTIPTSVRSLTRLAPSPEIGCPCTRISPFWMGSRRFTHRIRVLLPDPEGPQTTMTSPASTLRSTSVSTWWSRNHFLTALNSIAAATGSSATR